MSPILYLDPIGGLSGDMFVAAFLDAGLVELEAVDRAVRRVLPEVRVGRERAIRSGIMGSRFIVHTSGGVESPAEVIAFSSPGVHHDHGHTPGGHHDHGHTPGGHHDHGHAPGGHHDHGHAPGGHHDHGHAPGGHEHPHRAYADIRRQLEQSPLRSEIRARALAIFDCLAQAESDVHGTNPEEVLFHEVGADDAIADVIAAAVCACAVADRRLVCGPLPFGRGTIRFSHGAMPLPAPAVLALCQGLPTRPGESEGEMTTPTGAAIVAALFHEFGPPPALTPDRVGYGCGTRDDPHWPNLLRLIDGHAVEGAVGEPLLSLGSRAGGLSSALGGGATTSGSVSLSGVGSGLTGTTLVPAARTLSADLDHDEVVELQCHVDDQPPHLLAPAIRALMDQGAVDVLSTPYMGKKGRMGQLFTVLCRPASRERVAVAMLRELGTIGVRMSLKRRLKLRRQAVTLKVGTDLLRAKRAFGAGIDRVRAEADEVIRLAQAWGVTVHQADDRIRREAVLAPEAEAPSQVKLPQVSGHIRIHDPEASTAPRTRMPRVTPSDASAYDSPHAANARSNPKNADSTDGADDR